MTAIDLSDLTLKELKQLQKDIAKALEGFGNRKKSEALSVLEVKAQEFGFSLADLMGVKKPSKKVPGRRVRSTSIRKTPKSPGPDAGGNLFGSGP